MESLFCPYEQALALKELGFDEHCFGYFYTEDKFFETKIKNSELDEECSISAPTFSQAFRWFREKYGLHQVILVDEKGKYDIIVGKKISGACLGQYLTYEEAELECLKKLIELCKKN